ncbi:MAG: FAD-dependent thymidylate synthase [Parcubacteria group bacterium]|nr:FAD-dependent thymidylate synthase [Parcubacteria group bacterium]
MSKFTPEELKLLGEYVSDPTDNVFAVFPQKMPGMIGAAYARYSRARGGFRETLLKEFIKEGQLDPQRADELIARILIQYGDDSVQELESAWVSFEGISNIATKIIEDRRLGAYIEQSSRYVIYDERDEQGRFRYLREPTIMASGHGRKYEEVMDFVFETYCCLVEPMQQYFRRRKPLDAAHYEIREGRGKIYHDQCADSSERADFERTWRFDIRAKTCDTLRILLPAATLTNVGVHANGRTLEHILRHLYSSDLPEAQELATKARRALNTVIPRYVERAARSTYLVETSHNMQKLVDRLLVSVPVNAAPTVDVLERATDHMVSVIACMLYSFSEHPLRQLKELVRSFDGLWDEIVRTYVGERRSRRDRPGRALESGYPWQVDLVIDFGIDRDLQRHRMLTQTCQLLTTRLGFCEIPEEIVEAGLADVVNECIDKVTRLYEDLRPDFGREIAQYPVLLGFNRRRLLGFNDREAQHLLELRTIPQGHRSYRRVCQEIYRQMHRFCPWWAESLFGFVDLNEYDWPRADSEARQRAKEAKLKQV